MVGIKFGNASAHGVALRALFLFWVVLVVGVEEGRVIGGVVGGVAVEGGELEEES